MAVGDVVSDLSAAATILIFQAAVGVEVVITWLGSMSSGVVGYQMLDGAVNTSSMFTNNAADINVFGEMKMFVTNTNYLRLNAGAPSTAFSGIQTK